MNTILRAQTSFYLKPLLGPALPMMKGNIDGFHDLSIDQANVYHITNNSITLGQGFRYGLEAGCFFTSQFGFGFRTSFLHGKTFERTTESLVSSVKETNLQSLWNNMWVMTPIIELKPGWEHVNPVLSLGWSFASATPTLTEEISRPTLSEKKIWKYYGKQFSGPFSSLGFLVTLNEHFEFYVAVETQILNYKPQRKTCISDVKNGQEKIKTIEIFDKEKTYSNVYDIDYSVPPDPKKPEILPQVILPMSSLFLTAGITFCIGSE